MHHDVFGDIAYRADDQSWLGHCALPTFGEYGRRAAGALEEPDGDLLRGVFPLTIQDFTGRGPSAPQADAFRFVRDHEPEVCRAVLSELLACYRSFRGSGWEWARSRRQSWLWGWLARLILVGERQTPEDLKDAVRCLGMELSTLYLGAYAYTAFVFETEDCLEDEHGVSVVFHPVKGAAWGDGSAIYHIEEADNINEA